MAMLAAAAIASTQWM